MTYLIFDESGEGEVVEEVGEVSPYVCVAVLAEAFVVETIHLRDLPRFVVSAENCHSVAISEFESNKESDGLDRVVPSVDVITHEEVVGVGRVAADAEQFREIMLDARVEVNDKVAKELRQSEKECQSWKSSYVRGSDVRIDHGYLRTPSPDISQAAHLTPP